MEKENKIKMKKDKLKAETKSKFRGVLCCSSSFGCTRKRKPNLHTLTFVALVCALPQHEKKKNF